MTIKRSFSKMRHLFKVLLLGLLALSGALLVYSFSDLSKHQPLQTPFSTTANLTSLQTEAYSTSTFTYFTNSNPVPVYTYRVVNVYPHDPNAFTEGLVYENGFMYEGTGLNGRSSLRRVELETGKILQIRTLPDQFFGEGVTIYGNKIIQLTWKSHVGFVYDKDSFELLQNFNYPFEGWGITHDERRLIVSDGTSTLHFLDPLSFEEIGQVKVSDNAGPVTNLNELEYIKGEIYANVWQTNLIARINPQTGQVTGWINLQGLLGASSQPVAELNGIAYDAEGDRLFVTGKLWPSIYEIKLVNN